MHIARYVANKYRTQYPCAHEDDLYSEALYWLCYYRGDDPALLTTKLNRRVVDYLRRVLLTKGKIFLEQPVEYEDMAVAPDQESRADHALRLRRLTGRRREIFTRHLYGELQQDIAEDMGMSRPAVCQHMKKAKQIYTHG